MRYSFLRGQVGLILEKKRVRRVKRMTNLNNENSIDFEMVNLLDKAARPHIWDEQPVFCFTSDIDWASEAVIERYFQQLPMDFLKLTVFVTHKSEVIEREFQAGRLQRGIHPNFLPGSSHGNTFREVIETCLSFAPEATCTRSHRAFDVTDTAHLLHNEYHFKCCSNTITTLTPKITPYWLESKLLQIPVFFEEGSFLYNRLGLSIQPYLKFFTAPGLKVISFHPINMAFNTPEIAWMRQIKDSLSREEFNHIDADMIDRRKNRERGAFDLVTEIIDLAQRLQAPVLTLDEIYRMTVET